MLIPILVFVSLVSIVGYNVAMAVPDPPAAPKLEATPGNEQATLTWNVPDNGGTPITAYMISARIGTVNPFSLLATVPAATTSYNATGLINDVPYQFIVYAVNEVGSGDVSNTVTLTPASLPGAVDKLHVHVTSSTFQIAWNAPAHNEHAPITEYVVTANVPYRSFDNPGIVKVYRFPSNITSTIEIDGISNRDYTIEIDRIPNRDYTITVHAVNRIGNGPPSDLMISLYGFS